MATYYMRADGTAVQKAITDCVSHGGLIQVTVTTHGYANGDVISIGAVTGTVEANGTWVITVINGNTFDLVGSVFVNAYISGGKCIYGGPSSDAAKCMSGAMMNAYTAFMPGDIIKMSSVGGIFRQLYWGRCSGAAGNFIYFQPEVAGELVKIRGTSVLTGWVSDTAPIYSITRTTSPTFSSATRLGMWEDDAPLFTANSKETMVPGSYFYDSGASKLYVWTYDGTNPDTAPIKNIEAVDVGTVTCGAFIVDTKDYLYFKSLWMERGGKDSLRVSSNAVVNNITLERCTLIDSDVGCGTANTSHKTINLINCTNVRHAYSCTVGASGTTMNKYNCIEGGVLGHGPPSNPGAGATHNHYSCLISGQVRGLYWLTNGAGGANNYDENTIFIDPKFISGGANGLGAATITSDDNLVAGLQAGWAALINAAGGKMGWEFVSDPGYAQPANAWTDYAAVIAAGNAGGAHTRHHPNFATTANGVDLTSSIWVQYDGTGSISYVPATFILSTTVAGGTGVSFSIDIRNAYGAYDCSILGGLAGSQGLIDYINTLAGYTAGYADTSGVTLTAGLGYTSKNISSTVLDTTTAIDIGGVPGNVALNMERLFDTEFCATDRTGGEFTDMARHFSGWNPIMASWPKQYWSAVGVGRLYARGFKSATTMDYFTNADKTLRMHLGSMYPLAHPIRWAQADTNSALSTAAAGLAEAENISAIISMWPIAHVMHIESATDMSDAALTAYVTRLSSKLIRTLGQVITDNEASGAVWDATNYKLTHKIIPVFDFKLSGGIFGDVSPGINAGAVVSGVPYTGPYPDIGAYEHSSGAATGLNTFMQRYAP